MRHKDMEKGRGEWSKYHAGLSLHSVRIRGYVLANRDGAGTGDATLENRNRKRVKVAGIEPSKQDDKNSLVMLQFRPERVERLVWDAVCAYQ